MADIIPLASRRKPQVVEYTVIFRHETYPDGTTELSMWVNDMADDPATCKSIAHDLRRAAKLLERS